MSIWLLKAHEAFRWDGIRLFGRTPVLVPPAWALASRVWEGVGVAPQMAEPLCAPVLEPLLDAIPTTTRRLALVVPDGTRVGPWREILPHLLRSVENRCRRSTTGSGTALTLLVASGVHAPLEPAMLRRHLLPGESEPEKLLEGWHVIQNGDNHFEDHRKVGETPEGTPVRLHTAYLEADWKILLGEISYHYFAGFGGGRKLVFPGLAEPFGVAQNHRRALGIPQSAWGDTDRVGLDGFDWVEACAPGSLAGNPVHEDLVAAADLAPPNWVVTLVEQPPSEVDPAEPRLFPAAVVQGPYPSALDDAAALHERAHVLRFTKAPSLLIADAGGEPRDATFLQAHKSLQHASHFVPPGSSVLLAAGCREGLGSATLARYAEDLAGFRPLAGARENPISVLHLQTLIALLRVVRSLRVALWSDLPEETTRALGMDPIGSEEAARTWCVERGSETSWGWLPRAERFMPARGWLGGGLNP